MKARWDFSDADHRRIWTLCVVLFAGVGVYAFTSNDGAGAVSSFFNSNNPAVRNNAMTQGTRAVLVFIRWLPLVFVPMILAQAYGQRERIDLAVFSGLVRRWRRLRPTAERPPGVNVTMPFFSICLTGAAAANARGPGFFIGLSVLLCWALWPRRSKRYPVPVWLGLAAVVIATGFFAARGMLQLHRVVEMLQAEWLAGMFSARGREGAESVTSIGKPGPLNLSGRVVMRVDLGPGVHDPPLLRTASFDVFRSPVWSANRRAFAEVLGGSEVTTWTLLPGKAAGNELTVHVSLSKSSDALSLPPGTGELRNLPVAEVRTNRFGNVVVVGTPGFVSYAARYGPGATLDGATNESDLVVPPIERMAIGRIADELNLASFSPAEKLKAVAQFFARNFSYTQNLETDRSAPPDETPLTSFLTRQRAGHCEYFATATVLLLRQAGVPARYATGYSVDEMDRGRGKGYVVRERHGHAWCLAYVGDRWMDFDTTPGVWRAGEYQRGSSWEPVRDWFSRMWFEFSRWRTRQSGIRPYLIGMVAVSAAIIVIRLVQKRQWRRSGATAETSARATVRLGEDSEFFEIERRLGTLGHVRDPGETHAAWLARLERTEVDTRVLRELHALHSRYRFDPAGLDAAERAQLRSRSAAWLATQSEAPRSGTSETAARA